MVARSLFGERSRLCLLLPQPVVYFWRSSHARVLTEKDTIVLGDFTNTTSDPVFDGTLREGLSVQLEQSPFLSLVSEEGINQTLRMMEKPTSTRLAPEIAREVCQGTGGAAALDGSIALIGSRYNLILKTVNCTSGGSLASTEAQANDKSHVLDALGDVASDMRWKLGESLSTLQKYSTPLEQATTPSLEALQAYSLGWKADTDAASLVFFQRATQLDPNFAMAYWAMGISYSDLGETTLSAECICKAFALLAGVSEREKQHIEGDYYYSVTGDIMRARSSYMLGAQTYPHESTFYVAIAGAANSPGQYEEGLRNRLECLRRAPYDSFAYRNVAFSYLLLDRIKEAEAILREAYTKRLDSNLAPVLYGIAFHQGDSAGMAPSLKPWPRASIMMTLYPARSRNSDWPMTPTRLSATPWKSNTHEPLELGGVTFQPRRWTPSAARTAKSSR
jgi:eukaryotic-like serine/threonine-protein kinase